MNQINFALWKTLSCLYYFAQLAQTGKKAKNNAQKSLMLRLFFYYCIKPIES